MLKGNVKIILYDVNGKEVERQEAHNLVTNATAELLDMVAGGGGAMTDIMPIAEKALGGLMLFDRALPEDASKFCIPRNSSGNAVHIVAIAARDADATHVNRGSFNPDESGKTATGYEAVWDFSTSQATKHDGRIASVALTDVNAGINPITYCGVALKHPSDTLKDANGNLYYFNFLFPLKYDKATQYLYFAYVVGGSGKTLSVNRVRVPFYEYGVADSTTSWGLVETVSANNILLEYDFSAARNPMYCVDDDYAYIYEGLNYEGNVSNLYYTKVSLADFSYTHETIVGAIPSYEYPSFCICGDYLYFARTDSIRRVLLSDTSSYTDFSAPGVSSNNILSPRSGGLIYVLPANVNYAMPTYVIYADGVDTFGNINYGARTIFPIDMGMLMVHTPVSGGSVYFDARTGYLGTVFNLQTPIQKTAATTMKVIYTLTDVTS